MAASRGTIGIQSKMQALYHQEETRNAITCVDVCFVFEFHQERVCPAVSSSRGSTPHNFLLCSH